MQLRLTRDEAELLRALCREMRTLLEADIPRSDPVVARLFPDAYEEVEDARKYRDLVGDELRSHKLAAVRSVEEGLGHRGPAEMALDEASVAPWLSFLTDARLAIGTRLEVTEEDAEREPDPDDPDAAALQVFHHLGWLQEMTLRGLEEEER